MQLVIAEKPSVARSIAEVIGAVDSKDGYMEGNGYLVSWCVGHLVELAQPESYGEQWKKWTYESLPVKPEKWQYEVKADTKAQYDVLYQLMHREDVSATICATDAGREGELIFRLVYEMAGCDKPIRRLWISSIEEIHKRLIGLSHPAISYTRRKISSPSRPASVAQIVADTSSLCINW